jgi:hypothetical protein
VSFRTIRTETPDGEIVYPNQPNRRSARHWSAAAERCTKSSTKLSVSGEKFPRIRPLGNWWTSLNLMEMSH